MSARCPECLCLRGEHETNCNERSRRGLSHAQRLQRIEKLLREANFDGFVHPSVVKAHKLAKDGIAELLK